MATTPNYWMPNPTGQNTYDGSSFALNPYQYANQQGTQFASDNLARLLGGGAPQTYNVQPTAGPYQTPGQATFGGEGRATDGTMLGGMNAGQVARLYSMYPRHVADQMMADEMKMLSGGAINPTVQIPGEAGEVSPAAGQALSSGARSGATGARGGTGTAQGGFGSPSGSGVTWNAGASTPGSSPVGGATQPRTNPYAGLFGNPQGSGGNGIQLPGSNPPSGARNPYSVPTGNYTPGNPLNMLSQPRQSSPFGGTTPGAGQFMYNPTTQSMGGNPVLSMLQNVLGLRSSMNRSAPSLGGAQRPVNMQNILGSNYQTARTPAGYTRWQQQGG